MAQKDKRTPETETEKHCNCGPECTCGCNEGKECHCGQNGCCHGGCGRHCGGKLIVLLIIFLAGMGFNELLHGCFGRCPSKAPHAMPMVQAPMKHHGAMPTFTDGASTVIIINAADGHADVMHSPKHCKKHHHDMQKPHKNKDEMHKPPFGGRAATIRHLPKDEGKADAQK